MDGATVVLHSIHTTHTHTAAAFCALSMITVHKLCSLALKQINLPYTWHNRLTPQVVFCADKFCTYCSANRLYRVKDLDGGSWIPIRKLGGHDCVMCWVNAGEGTNLRVEIRYGFPQCALKHCVGRHGRYVDFENLLLCLYTPRRFDLTWWRHKISIFLVVTASSAKTSAV